MLALSVSLDLTLRQLTFINNTDNSDELSVCINIKQTISSNVLISNCTFIGNTAVYSTLANIVGVKSLTLDFIIAINNIATSTSAGVMYTPIVNDDSFITVTNCFFQNNSALRNGIIYITEDTGNMLNGGSHATVIISNTTFIDNKSTSGGCSLTITGFIIMSNRSRTTENQFINNVCAEGGAGLYIIFMSGVMLVDGNLFQGNLGTTGAAIHSTHQGSSDGSTYLDVKSCVFQNNSGATIIDIAGVNTPLFLSEGNVFDSNVGSCISVRTAIWRDSNSNYYNNIASEGGVFEASYYTEVTLSNFSASKNLASTKGGVASISTNSIVTCTNCTLFQNTCDEIGGVVSIDLKSAFNCISCDFNQNIAKMKGSIIFSLFSNVSFTSSVLRGNQALEYGTVSLTESNFWMDNSEMSRNVAESISPGIVGSVSNITITNCVMKNQTGLTGAFLFTAVTNIVLIENTTFSDCRATYGGVFYSMIFSTVTVRDSTISSCSADIEGSVAQIRDSTFILENVTISNVTTVLSNGAFYMVQSELNMTGSTLKNIVGSAVISTLSNITVSDSAFENIVGVYGSAINCIDCTNLLISTSVFTNNLAQKGGAIYSFTTGLMLIRISAVYRNNTFINNKSVNGGAIYSESMDISLTGNVFFNNSVNSGYYLFDGLLKLRGEGGAVYCACGYILFCDISMSLNTFVNNTAEIQGGAIYWVDSYPFIEENTMQNNSAVYGSDIASFPIRLVLLNTSNQIVSYLSNDSIPLVTTFADVASGQESNETIQLGLVDHYNHIVSIDNKSGAQLFMNDTVLNVAGTTQVLAVGGIFTFHQLIFNGEPTTYQNFTVTTTGVDQALRLYNNDQNTYYPSVSVTVNFRKCLKGESLQGVSCYLCPAGTFSLDPSKLCNTCPNNVVCYGNYTMTPEPGYWRPDPSLDLFFACLFADACLGSPASLSQVSLTGQCAEGYEGNLCTSCQIGYSRQGKYQCGQCPSLASNIAISSVIIGVALLIGAFIVFISIRGATRPRSELAIYLKIFVNYLQMVTVAASLNLNWPDFVTQVLNGQNTAGSVTEQLFSFDCIMQRMSVQQVYYTKLAGEAMLPAALMLFAMLAWLLFRCCKRIVMPGNKLIATLVLILFILHPTLSKLMFSLFSCMELKPGELWLISDMSLRCWSSDHVKNILMIAVPSIIVWIIGLPAVCVVFLYKKKTVLTTDESTQLKFSFLYKGYQAHWYFWEFVILYRKVALICSSVFLSTVSITVQALSVLAVLLVSLFFQLQIKPFFMPTFNHLELKSILVSSITIYSGLFYQTQSISKCYPDIEVKVLLFIAILAINGYFLLSWVRCVLPNIFKTIKQRFFTSHPHNDVRPSANNQMRVNSDSRGMSSNKLLYELHPSILEVNFTQLRMSPDASMMHLHNTPNELIADIIMSENQTPQIIPIEEPAISQ